MANLSLFTRPYKLMKVYISIIGEFLKYVYNLKENTDLEAVSTLILNLTI
ncbi:hypothetical protein ACJOV8_018185 [Formosa sp. 3Alg 14/1]